MTQQLVPPQPAEPEGLQLAANAHLKKIEEHLRSIRNMLTFFTVLTIVVLILQFIGMLASGFAP